METICGQIKKFFIKMIKQKRELQKSAKEEFNHYNSLYSKKSIMQETTEYNNELTTAKVYLENLKKINFARRKCIKLKQEIRILDKTITALQKSEESK